MNYLLEHFPITDFLANSANTFLQCLIASVIGLIPNCAISIAITMMLIKGTITFGAAMSGLLSNAGLGLLVLLKNNNLKDSAKVVGILFLMSLAAGCLIEFIM